MQQVANVTPRSWSFARALLAAFFSRASIILAFWTVAAFMGSLLARRIKGYRPFDLFMIGVLGLPLIAAGSASDRARICGPCIMSAGELIQTA